MPTSATYNTLDSVAKSENVWPEFWRQESFNYKLPLWDAQGNQAGPEMGPELTVSPTPDDLNTATLMRNAIPNDSIRKNFYDWTTNNGGFDSSQIDLNISDKDKADRFLNLYNNAQQPSINLLTPDIAVIGKNGDGTLRDYYRPSENAMYIDPNADLKLKNGIMSELPHAFQYYDERTNNHWLTPSQWKLDAHHATGADTKDKNGLNSYNRLGNLEYNAHSIIQPVMEDYVLGRKQDFLGGKAIEDFNSALGHYTTQAVSHFRNKFPQYEDPYSSFKLYDKDKELMSPEEVKAAENKYTENVTPDYDALSRLKFPTSYRNIIKVGSDEFDMDKMANTNIMLGFANGGSLHKRWNDLSIKEKRDMMKVAISNGITNLSDIKDKYNEFAMGGDTVGEWADAIYSNNPKEEFLGEPSHHYDFTQTDEWADAHGYYPDARGHRDDRVKKPAHPSHPSRGTWDGDKFILSDLGMQNPNYTLFGLNDGGQDPQAILTYRGGSVIPEITATPKGNYIENPYDNTKLHFAEGGNLYNGGGYVYDILPQLFAMDGVPVTVTSGYRPGAVVAGTNRLSRHARHEAVDLRGDFARMQQVLNNPNSNVTKWMLANGYGYLNEAPTFGGTTKYWPKKYFRPDGTPDFHDHFHIGKDFGSKYAASFRGVPQQQQPRAMYTGMGWRNIAADNIMRHEGFMQHSYADAPKGKSWRSIGYGFNDSGFYNKYPMGISKYYDARGGITRAEAQQELNYMLDNMERQARAAYGSKWNQFNDNQKAAIMDTMYQRPASVLKGSQFHRAVMAGDPNAVNYLGVNGFDKRNADRRGLFGSPNQYAMQQPMMVQQNPFPDFQPSNPQAFYGQGNSAIDREMAEKMANMEATMKAYQEAQEQQQLAAARQAERQEKAARANLAWNFVMGMNGDNQQQSPYMGLLGALSSNSILGEES